MLSLKNANDAELHITSSLKNLMRPFHSVHSLELADKVKLIIFLFSQEYQ